MIPATKRKALAALILISEFAFASYVYNFTSRTKQAVPEYLAPGEVTALDISYVGDYVAVGDVSGAISLVQRGGLATRWRYGGDAPVKDVGITSTGQYVATVDSEGDVALLSFVPGSSGGSAAPLWVVRVPEGRLRGVFSLDMPVLVEVLVSGSEGLVLFGRDGKVGRVFDVSEVDSVLSLDGSAVVVLDSAGDVSLFDVRIEEPLWVYHSGLSQGSVAFSFDGGMIAVGGVGSGGGGEVLVLSALDGGLVVSHRWSSPVREVAVSAGGDRVVVGLGDGTLQLARLDGASWESSQLPLVGVSDFASSQYGSYVFGAGGGSASYVYLPRPAPLWSVPIEGASPITAISQNGGWTFLASGPSVAVFQNGEFSEVIPGSRQGWAAVFFSSAGLLLALFSSEVQEMGSKVRLAEAGLAALCFLVGTGLGYFFVGSLGRSALVCGAGSAVGFLIGARERGLGGLLFGSAYGLVCSVVGSYLYNALQWFGGDEASVVGLAILGLTDGVKLGLVFGVLGAVIAVTIGLLRRSGGATSRPV